jgi:signal recognition particle receptor subunit beta/predicted regulator of Ras-like GTPase activity (Roadblock/LC7/MglB family)
MRKFIFTGPVGAGKTTAIQTITEDGILHTDVKTSDAAGLRKETTTVAMDFAVVQLSNKELVHIYGTPGQERFDFMWDILSENADGLIILLDNSRNYPYRDLRYYIEAFAGLIEKVPLAIGVTRMDVKDNPNLDQYRYWLQQLSVEASLFNLDAREKNDVLMVLEQLAGISVNTASQQAVLPLQSRVEQSPTVLNTLDHIASINGVVSASLADAYGETLMTTHNKDNHAEVSAYLSAISDTIASTLELGHVKRVMLKGHKENNLHLFLDEAQTLSIEAEKKVSMPAMAQQVEDILQWS